ncbi:MAG: hypothetical protein QOG83_2871 [Alphaproteobacteria bacterium]|nr:hypothetical protein [Alphaproteobacteria bacterium]
MSDPLQFFHEANLDYSWLAKFFSLIVLPLADEDFAIILGGYIVVNNLMPVGLVVLTIYCGMITSDFVFYGIGAAARRVPWLSRWAINGRVKNVGETLKRNLFELVALCRVVPGIDLFAFIACGWTKVPLSRFLLASLVVSALYLPLMLYLVVVFGDALDDHVGLWAWPFLLAIVVVAGFVRNRIFSFREPGPVRAAQAAAAMPSASRFRVYEARYRQQPALRLRVKNMDVLPRAMKWFKSR